jgi:Ca-activated chloride channel family protein
MNTKMLYSLCLLVTLALPACAPAATPAPSPIAEAPRALTTQPPALPPSRQPAAPTAAAALPFTPAATATWSNTAPAPAAPPPADNSFQDYGVNPDIDTREQHLSTFGLDVDTASYTVTRRYINDGNLPPIDAVRVEEFVNFFQQDYGNPANVAFGIYADGAPSPFYRDGTAIMRVGVQGYRVSDEERKPSSLTFVIDISGSMDMENRLGLVKRSLQLLVDRLRPVDSVGIVVFGSQARVALEPTNGADRNTILRVINRLRTEGSTNAAAGLRLGYEMAMRSYRNGGINRVILCSDGVANVGTTDADGILETIHGFVSEGITLTTVGFGMGNFNDTLLEQMADKGNGNYAYVDTLEEAQRLFVDKLTSTLQVIAMDAKVQVDFNPDVVYNYRLIGYENRAVANQDFRNDSVDAGEIGAGHSVTALYALRLRPSAQGRIATVQLRWKDPDTADVHEINGNFNSWDLVNDFEAASPRFQQDVVVAQFAEVLRGSPWAGYTSLHSIGQYANRLVDRIPGDNDVSEFANLVARAARLELD